jgi:hypothetical protein
LGALVSQEVKVQKVKGVDLQWRCKAPATGSKGVLIGCDHSQEWLLSWWYMNFRLHNQYPVTFVNFGDMSREAVLWCESRGTVVLLDCGDEFIAKVGEIDQALASDWEARRAKIWQLRQAWFKIPFCWLSTPYEKSVWMDLDCQVVGPIDPLFNEFLKIADFAIAKESQVEQEAHQALGGLLPGEEIYNAGVVAYRHGSLLVDELVRRVVEQNHRFMGVQKILARIILENRYYFFPLPSEYNWAMAGGKNKQAIVLHHWGAYQDVLRRHIAFLKNKMFIDLSI